MGFSGYITGSCPFHALIGHLALSLSKLALTPITSGPKQAPQHILWTGISLPHGGLQEGILFSLFRFFCGSLFATRCEAAAGSAKLSARPGRSRQDMSRCRENVVDLLGLESSGRWGL